MNLYLDLASFKSALGITVSTDDAFLLANLEAASRLVDVHTRRHFYTAQGTRYFDTQWPDRVLMDDCLAITSFYQDSDRDATYDGTTMVEGADYYLWPDNEWPKLQARVLQGYNNALGGWSRRHLKITGTWGYGDGQSNDPWALTAVTGTVATTSGTALTISVSAGISAGATIRLGTEQMYVESVSTTTATVRRAVNGTTATAHTAAAIYTAKYPAVIKQAVQWLASLWRNEATSPGIRMQMIGEYQEQRGGNNETERHLARLLGGYTR